VVKNSLIKEDQGIHGLVPGGRGNVRVHRQMGEEGLDPGFGRIEILA